MEQTILISMPASQLLLEIEASVRKVLSERLSTTEDKLINSDEVMKLLNISTTTLQTWRDKKKIPFTRIGKKIFYNKAEILKAQTTSL